MCADTDGPHYGPNNTSDSTTDRVTSTDSTTDRDVLVAFYHATNGDNWLRSGNWLTDAPIGRWYGVVTDGSDRVIGLISGLEWVDSAGIMADSVNWNGWILRTTG